MSISERMRRGLSLLAHPGARCNDDQLDRRPRAGTHCLPQDHTCAPKATLACRSHAFPPGPPDTARRLDVAPPSGTPSRASLMEVVGFLILNL